MEINGETRQVIKLCTGERDYSVENYAQGKSGSVALISEIIRETRLRIKPRCREGE